MVARRVAERVAGISSPVACIRQALGGCTIHMCLRASSRGLSSRCPQPPGAQPPAQDVHAHICQQTCYAKSLRLKSLQRSGTHICAVQATIPNAPRRDISTRRPCIARVPACVLQGGAVELPCFRSQVEGRVEHFIVWVVRHHLPRLRDLSLRICIEVNWIADVRASWHILQASTLVALAKRFAVADPPG